METEIGIKESNVTIDDNSTQTQDGIEYLLIEKDGFEYQIPTHEMELEVDKYKNAWKIVKQQPHNYLEFLEATMYARADTSQKRLGCGYGELSEQLQSLFDSK